MNTSASSSNDPEETNESVPHRYIPFRNFESLIDQQMRTAEAAGAFEQLPGAGKPLDLHDDDYVPEEMRVGFRLLKGNGYTPSWIDMQKQVRASREQFSHWLAQLRQRWPHLKPHERAAWQQEYEQRLRDLNREITNYNLTAPPVVGQMALLQAEDFE
ncbi:DUF1992 domain-containing protein [Candidatus Oscillochloris fontis]|uniref:DnaJ family domain-containing protein n=1 Tax=Candidatus Oscillochloris fontis TaxID=2496868 RepID=UPI00101C9A1B|nr:DUF1992 domain-containing protein [Candidatus Oscillochloris fontis]